MSVARTPRGCILKLKNTPRYFKGEDLACVVWGTRPRRSRRPQQRHQVEDVDATGRVAPPSARRNAGSRRACSCSGWSRPRALVRGSARTAASRHRPASARWPVGAAGPSPPWFETSAGRPLGPRRAPAGAGWTPCARPARLHGPRNPPARRRDPARGRIAARRGRRSSSNIVATTFMPDRIASSISSVRLDEEIDQRQAT